jgi:hypothetical protein
LFSQAQQLHDFLSIHSTALGENFQIQNEPMVKNNLIQELVKKNEYERDVGVQGVTYNTRHSAA